MIIEFNDQEEPIMQEIMSLLSNKYKFQTMKPPNAATLSFPGLEIRLHQRRVLRDGIDLILTRLEYGTLVYLATNPGILLSQAQIFEAVWHMDSNACHSSVINVIYSLRKKIEPDSKKPIYIKTVPRMGYIFNAERDSRTRQQMQG